MDYDPDLDWRVIEDAGFNTHIGPLMSVRLNETTWRHTGMIVSRK